MKFIILDIIWFEGIAKRLLWFYRWVRFPIRLASFDFEFPWFSEFKIKN